MNITLDLPEALVTKLNTYLEKHPQASCPSRLNFWIHDL